MEKKRSLAGEGWLLDLHLGEIPVRGEGFLAVKDCLPGCWEAAVAAGVQLLRDCGAKRILATSRLEESPFMGEQFQLAGFTFDFCHQLEILQYDLVGYTPRPNCPLDRELLSTANLLEFVAIYNSSMAEVPNTVTYTPEDFWDMTAPGKEVMLFRRDGIAVAFAELDTGAPVPQIEGIGVAPQLQGQGLGRQLLEYLLGLMATRGESAVQLMVSSGNPGARQLYLRMGFAFQCIYSKWYNIVI